MPFQRTPATCWVLILAGMHRHGMCGHMLKITKRILLYLKETLEYHASGIFGEPCVSLLPFCRHRLSPITPQGQHVSRTGGTPQRLCKPPEVWDFPSISVPAVCPSWVCLYQPISSGLGVRGQPRPRVAAADVRAGSWVPAPPTKPPSPATVGSGEFYSCLVLCQDWVFLRVKSTGQDISMAAHKNTQPLCFPHSPFSPPLLCSSLPTPFPSPAPSPAQILLSCHFSPLLLN